MDPIDAAAGLLREQFPDAIAAFLGGSVVTPARNATSDLDIVVMRRSGRPVYRETARHEGWTAELFVHTLRSYQWFLDREIPRRRCPLLHMVGNGVIVLDSDGTAALLHQAAREQIAAGPPPPTPDELDDLRYGLSDLLDDLDGATDPDEITLIANGILTTAATLALTGAGVWLGGGKWLSRRLLASDPALHRMLLAAHRAAVADGDTAVLGTVAAGILDRAGGRLMHGYHRDAPAEATRADAAN
ncbi:MAG TPA: nucleotidyltransferase domain-containing protein [Micromonosporaceae bacterium]|nr:nucleotidyltransferase domain-containing protein [Micromonosporaceae bacterium]